MLYVVESCRSAESIHGDRKKLGFRRIPFPMGWLLLRPKSLIVQFSLECYESGPLGLNIMCLKMGKR